jgi:hypothetical protein
MVRAGRGIPMITIEYLTDNIEGEAPPHFYWRGKPKDYLQLINDLYTLVIEEGSVVDVGGLSYIKMEGVSKVTLRSSANGDCLCKKEGDQIIVDLTGELWREVLLLFFSICFSPSHNYVEFDELELVEDANFVISSEA